MNGKQWMTAVAIAAAASVASSHRPAHAETLVWTGAGDGVSWTDPNNWVVDNSDPPINQAPGAADQTWINNTATVTLDASSSVGSFAIGHNSGVARLNILPGMDFTVNNTSRVGRGAGGVIGGVRGEIWQSGGTVHFTGGNRRLGLSYDARPAGEFNADSLYVISGGTLTFEGTGSIHLGRDTSTFNRAEFRVVGTGPSLIHLGTGAGGDLIVQGGATQGDAYLHFVIDSGGVTPITVGDELRLMNGSKLQISVMSQTVPTTDIDLVIADRLTENEMFDGLPGGSDVSAIFSNRLYEWTLAYQDGNDDGLLDAFVRLTLPRSFRGGDANKDGTVNLQDFNILAANFGTSGAGWTMADFNGDTIVNLADFNILAGNFGLSGSPGGPTPGDWAALGAAVPEPAALGLFGAAGIALLRRRRG